LIDNLSDRGWRAGAALLLLALAAGCATQSPESGPDTAADGDAAMATDADTSDAAATDAGTEVTREAVKPSHPVRYTVQRGDTLWDIASRFLKKPWVWPEIWSVNPQIDNPHLIYPGDIITLAYRDGEPRLVVNRPGGEPATGDGYQKLEPQVRERSLDEAIATIPGDAIRQFLNRPRVVSREQLEKAPYVLGNYEGRLYSAAGNDLFARGFTGDGPSADRYSLYRAGEALRSPETGKVIGYEALYVGKAALQKAGDPARFTVTESTREIAKGDRLMPAQAQISPSQYIPQRPNEAVDAQIIKLFEAISQIGTNQIVVINHGRDSGAEVNEILGIEQSGGRVTDPYAGEADEQVQLPPQRVGTLMIFRVFDRVSYGLTLDATQAIQVGDQVTNP